MVILILINIVIIVYIYLKYNRLPGNINSTNETIEDKDAIIMGYIYDEGMHNNFDFILAEIIELNIKGYIIIEYRKESIDKYNYTIRLNTDIGSHELQKYEMLLLNFLFADKMEITKMELEEKLNNTFRSYHAQFNEIGEILNQQLLEQNIIDAAKQKELDKTTKRYIKISILLVLLVSILGTFKILEVSGLYMFMYILEKVVASALLLKANVYTEKGQILKYHIECYKMELEKQEFLIDKNTMEEIVRNKEFANSIALHIKTQAKKALIDDKMIKEATRISKKTVTNMFIVFAIIILVGLIIAKVTTLLSTQASFWLYFILVIAIACVADITLYKKK